MKYDHGRVLWFVDTAEKAYDRRTLLVLVSSLMSTSDRVNLPMPDSFPVREFKEVAELYSVWLGFGAWERAGVMFRLAPLVNQAVVDMAKELTAMARQEDDKERIS